MNDRRRGKPGREPRRSWLYANPPAADGLSGIYAASRLQHKKASFIVIKARNRIGVLIVSPQHREFFADMGPSWYWPEIQPKMARLVEILGLSGFVGLPVVQRR